VDEAEAVCWRVHGRLATHLFEEAGAAFHITLSIGVAQCNGHSADAVLKLADRNLYRAKQEGRNRSVYSVDSNLDSEVGP
jgi:diguanylate cyclase (GGDEF)-like protein